MSRPVRVLADPPQCDAWGCRQVGPHFCKPRARRVVQFFGHVLVHTKGRWARQPFDLADWQRLGIIEPTFGWVEWSEESQRYVRQRRVAWIEVARKNGKSEILAGLALALLIADDEPGAEIYGCALDMKQAQKVYDVAARMVRYSDLLQKRLRVYQEGRIVDERTGSSYVVLAGDPEGNLGHNPSGIIFDEVIAQPSRDLWDVMRTGYGARTQPLMLAATTAGNDLTSFAHLEHDYSMRAQEDPGFDPRRLAYIRNTPEGADPWKEDNWYWANPALGDFLSIETLRDEAREARQEPAKENAFRQFRLCQWVQSVTRWLPLALWDGCTGAMRAPADLERQCRGERCYGGLDLSSKFDLTSLCWVFPDLGNLVLWRFWVPEEALALLDRYTGGQASVWARQGWLSVCPGGVIDYDALYRQLAQDAHAFQVEEIAFDPWNAGQAYQEMVKMGLSAVEVGQGVGLSEAMKELMRWVREHHLEHAGNPVARWNADCVEVREDQRERIYPVKPKRWQSGKRIDGIAALVMAIDGLMRKEANQFAVAAF